MSHEVNTETFVHSFKNFNLKFRTEQTHTQKNPKMVICGLFKTRSFFFLFAEKHIGIKTTVLAVIGLFIS